MKNVVFDFFREYRFLQFADLIDIYKITSLKQYKAGEIIARQGQQFEDAICIRQGIIRTYVLTSDGDEKTVRFAKDGDFTACSRSLLYGQPSTEFLEAVEDTKVIQIDTTKLKMLTNDNIRLLRLWSQAISNALFDAILRIEFFTSLTPEERYLHLLEVDPELVQRVPQKFLASYVGVTTVSLSRIRSRVAPKSS